MKLIIKLSFFLLFTSLVSCGPHRVYTTGSYGSLKTYTEKQHYVDKKTTHTYISGDVSLGTHMQDDEAFNDTKTIVSLNAHRNTTGKFYNYYYGLGASMGAYKFKKGYSDLIETDEKKSFYNINLKTGANITYSRPKIDYRFIGVEFAYLNEFGPYQDKLTKLLKANDNGLTIVNQKSMFTYHLYSEYAFKISAEDAFTIGFYFGDIMNLKKKQYSGDVWYNGFSLGLRVRDYTVHILFESGENQINSAKLGLTYRL